MNRAPRFVVLGDAWRPYAGLPIAASWRAGGQHRRDGLPHHDRARRRESKAYRGGVRHDPPAVEAGPPDGDSRPIQGNQNILDAGLLGVLIIDFGLLLVVPFPPCRLILLEPRRSCLSTMAARFASYSSSVMFSRSVYDMQRLSASRFCCSTTSSNVSGAPGVAQELPGGIAAFLRGPPSWIRRFDTPQSTDPSFSGSASSQLLLPPDLRLGRHYPGQ